MEEKVTQPPFSYSMIEGYADYVINRLSKIHKAPYYESEFMECYKNTTSYKKRTGLYVETLEFLMKKGIVIEDPISEQGL